MIDLKTARTEMVKSLISLLMKEDEKFPQAKADYEECLEMLKAQTGETLPFIHEYDYILKQMLAAELVYSFCLGIKANLAIFRDPIANNFLNMDFDDFLREDTARTLPDYCENFEKLQDYYSQLPDELKDATEPITEFETFLETYGPKLAHYYGFIYGNAFLPSIEPGYHANRSFTNQYCAMVKHYLEIDLPILFPEQEKKSEG